jgi:hypothetical protein
MSLTPRLSLTQAASPLLGLRSRSVPASVAPTVALLFFAALATLFWVRPASATPTPADAAAAQAAYDRGKQLLSAGKYPEACAKLEESQKLDPGAGTQYHLADCWEHVGRTASAWAAFLDVAAASRAAGRADREKVSRGRAAALEPRLSRLTIAVAAKDTPGLQIQRDGQVVGPALWETPIPVDLGTHAITATASGKQPWQGKLDVATEGANATITVPALLDAPAEGAQPLGGAPPSGGGTALPLAEEPRKSFWSQSTIGLVVGGAGVVAMGVAIPVALAAKAKFEDVKPRCTGGCNPTDAAANDSAISLGNAATAVLVAGAVVAAAGGVVWLTAPRASASKQTDARSPRVDTRGLRVGVTATGTGLLIHGAFQ